MEFEFPRPLSLDEIEKFLNNLATHLPLNIYSSIRQEKRLTHTPDGNVELKVQSTHQNGRIRYLDDFDEFYTFDFRTFSEEEFKELKYDVFRLKTLPSQDKLTKLEETIKDYLSRID